MASVDELVDLIAKELQNYTDKVTEEVKNAVDKTSEEVNEEIKNHITFNQVTGKYIKSFRLKTSYEDKWNKRNTWYVANGEHRKTHLLEHGHISRDGKRVKAYPHIRYGEELAQKRLEELIKKAVEE